MARLFNSKRGGFGTAPNFPHPEMLGFCLRRFAETGDLKTRSAAFDLLCFTVQRMGKGGIFD